MQGRLDIYLARHCAPTLLGAKAASLVSLPYKDFPDLPQLARNIQGGMLPAGWHFCPCVNANSAAFCLCTARPA